MNHLLLTAAETSIPDRPATTMEALALIGQGWGSIFLIILLMIVFVLILNRITKSK